MRSLVLIAALGASGPLVGPPASTMSRALAESPAGVAGPAGWAWGANNVRQLGTGTTTQGDTPAIVDVTGKPVAIAANADPLTAGSDHGLALTSDGTVWTWGSNSKGQLGNPCSGASCPALPSVLAAFQGLVATTGPTIAAGGTHDLAIASDGTLWAWGDNTFGQLGDGSSCATSPSSCTSSTPVRVRTDGLPTGTTFTAVAAGANHSLALASNSNGSVYAWGDNTFGQIASTATRAGTPQPVYGLNGLGGIKAIAAGNNFSLALTNDGRVYAWGDNTDGQLGIASSLTVSSTNAPLPVLDASGQPLSNVVAIAAGGAHSLAVTSDGTVWAWGLDLSGQLGATAPPSALSCPTSSSTIPTVPCNPVAARVVTANGTPLVLPGPIGPTSIAAGQNHSLAIANGAVWAWGDNTFGQMGNGSAAVAATTPAAVQGLAGATAVMAGSNESFALAPVPAMSVGPASIDFGSQTVGVSSQVHTVTVLNTGTVPVTVKTVTLQNPFTLASTPPFAITATSCTGATLPPGGSCTVGVTYTPSFIGFQANGSLTFADGALDSPQTVTLTGIGAAPPTATNTPAPTSTATATNTPAPTSTATVTNTPIPPSTATPVTTTATGAASTTGLAPILTRTLPVGTAGGTYAGKKGTSRPHGSRLALSVVLASARVSGGGTLTIRLHTAARAAVSGDLAVTRTRITYSGTGTHRKKIAKTTTVFKVAFQGHADAHGGFSRRLHVSYKPARAAPAHLTITARSGHNAITRTVAVTILPPAQPHAGALALTATVRSTVVTSGRSLIVSVHTVAHARIAVLLQVRGPKGAAGKTRTRTGKAVLLYHAGVQGTADRRGAFAARIHVAYKPARSVRATLTITASAGRSTATRTIALLIRPVRG